MPFYDEHTRHYCAHIPAVFVFSVTQTLTNTCTSFETYPGQFNAAGGSARRIGCLDPLIGGSQKLEERTVTIRQAVCLLSNIIDELVKEPTLNHQSFLITHQFLLKSKTAGCLIFKNYPLKIHTWRQSFFLGQFLYYSQSGNDPKKKFSQIWLQTKYESNVKKTILVYCWLPS